MAKRNFRTLADVFGGDDEKPAPQPQQDSVGERLDKLERQIEELKKIVVNLPDTLQQLLTT